MLNRDKIIQALSDLGEEINACLNGEVQNTELQKAVKNSCINNYWFTKDNIYKALKAIADNMLDKEKLTNWVSRYPFNISPKKTGIIMAGNIPLVGMHDLLCVLLSGNIAVIKPSSKDNFLIKTVCEMLVKHYPQLENNIVFTDSKPVNTDMVIATGSNNSARYFKSEYKNAKILMRKNRYSIAVLSGNETEKDLMALGDDIFSYFGLGCRNVSNLFVPENYNWDFFFDSIKTYADIMEHEGYNDCFRYQKAISELSCDGSIDNGFIILRSNNAPAFTLISAINIHPYKDIEQVRKFIELERNDIQCIVSGIDAIENKINFGHTQKPGLDDYADGVDTMEFLCS